MVSSEKLEKWKTRVWKSAKTS